MLHALRSHNIEVFTRRKGLGSLRIGFIMKGSGDVTRQDLIDAAAGSLGEDIEHKEVETDHLSGILIELAEEGVFQREWFLCDRDLMFMIPYDCDVEHRDTEVDDVNGIVDSIQLTRT